MAKPGLNAPPAGGAECASSAEWWPWCCTTALGPLMPWVSVWDGDGLGRRDVKWPGFEDSRQGKMVMTAEHVFVALFLIEMILKVRRAVHLTSHTRATGERAATPERKPSLRGHAKRRTYHPAVRVSCARASDGAKPSCCKSRVPGQRSSAATAPVDCGPRTGMPTVLTTHACGSRWWW
jgi:hypothetical protein